MIDIFENIDTIFWIAVIIIFLILIFPVIRKIQNRRLLKSATTLNRGTKSERDLVLRLLKQGIHPKAIFHDLCVKKNNGKFSQIDVVVATAEGILVFEVKDYSGWIFGNANYSHWTQVLAYGKRKYRFYNPVKQNNSHLRTLKEQLKQFRNIPFFSIVVFYGDCELKEINYIPKGTFLVKPHRLRDILHEISFKNGSAPYSDKREIIRFLEEAVKNGENLNHQEQHISDIKDMLGKDRIYD